MTIYRTRLRRLHGRRVLAIVMLAWVVYLASLAIRICRDGRRDEQAPADVIIVLGAAQYDGVPSPVFAARLDHALALYHRGIAPYLLCTGGKRAGDRFTEAESGKRYLAARDVPASAIFIEDHGRTTWQSLQTSAAMLRQARLPRVILVSDPFHALRLHRMAADLRMHAQVSPVANSPIRSLPLRTRYILREVAVYTVYRLVGM